MRKKDEINRKRKGERERRRMKEKQRGRKREIETGRLNEERGETEKETAWKVGSFAAGSNDPGCIDSWGCTMVRVDGENQMTRDEGRQA